MILLKQRVVELDSSTMCPPLQHHQLSRQAWLQILCFLLALANLLTFSKLLYDYYHYKVW